ncbi:unnamed protein product [Ectocarpus sp. 13 AM-2016]
MCRNIYSSGWVRLYCHFPAPSEVCYMLLPGRFESGRTMVFGRSTVRRTVFCPVKQGGAWAKLADGRHCMQRVEGGSSNGTERLLITSSEAAFGSSWGGGRGALSSPPSVAVSLSDDKCCITLPTLPCRFATASRVAFVLSAQQ